MIDQFGKYLLLKRLAVGGMAEIFLAKQTGVQGFEKLVVVKRILPTLVTEREFVNMFLDEARLAASLNHPNIIQIYDLGEVNGSFFIAMEFIAGHDLSSVIKRARQLGTAIPVDLGARMLVGACEGLHYAHTKQDLRGQPLHIVHRDVSPGNILVSYDGGVKVADFGIAKAESQSSKTEAGKLKGKFAYMAPELIQSEPIDARADIFGLGIVLHEVLTGRRLFKRDSELAILRDILEGEVKPPSALRDEVPRALDSITMRALQKDRRKRYQTAQEMQVDLERYLATRPVQPSSMHVAQLMMSLFEPDHRAHQTMLRELPTATPDQLAAMFHDPTPAAKSSGSYSQPAIARPELDEPSGHAVTVPAKRGALKAVVAGVALLGLGAAGVWAVLPKHMPAPTSGLISVESDPPGAKVVLDGQPTQVVTPGALTAITFDADHTVRLELDGREAREAVVRLTPDLPSKALSLTLPAVRAAPGTLELTSEPAGGTVYVDGRVQKGVTPLSLSLSAGEEHVVRVVKTGFADAEGAAKVEPGKSSALTLTLKSREPAVVAVDPKAPKNGPPRAGKTGDTGQVSLSSDPVADVFFEGKSLGRTPLTARLPAGKVTLAFVNKELDLSQTAQVVVDGKGPNQSAITFKKGKVAADVTPWADVYLGDRKLGTTPLAPRDLYEGTYTLRLVNSELGAIKTLKVVVQPGKTTVVREALK